MDRSTLVCPVLTEKRRYLVYTGQASGDYSVQIELLGLNSISYLEVKLKGLDINYLVIGL